MGEFGADFGTKSSVNYHRGVKLRLLLRVQRQNKALGMRALFSLSRWRERGGVRVDGGEGNTHAREGSLSMHQQGIKH